MFIARRSDGLVAAESSRSFTEPIHDWRWRDEVEQSVLLVTGMKLFGDKRFPKAAMSGIASKARLTFTVEDVCTTRKVNMNPIGKYFSPLH